MEENSLFKKVFLFLLIFVFFALLFVDNLNLLNQLLFQPLFLFNPPSSDQKNKTAALETTSQKVLAELKKNQEICQLVKSGPALLSPKEFWLICNGRPFYAIWEKNQLNTPQNGWGFLQTQPSILQELQNHHCRLYQTSTANPHLSFICTDGKVLSYTYSTPDFQFTKQKEGLFLNEIFRDLWAKNVLPCEPTNSELVTFNQQPFFEITLHCQNQEAKIFFDLQKLVFSLPVVIDLSLSDQTKVEASIKLLNLSACQSPEIRLTKSQHFSATVNCPQGQLLLDYDLSLGQAQISLPKDNFTQVFPLFSPFLFPFLNHEEMKKLATSQGDASLQTAYQIGSTVIIAQGPQDSNLISQIYLKDEGLE